MIQHIKCLLGFHKWGTWIFKRDKLKTTRPIVVYEIFRCCSNCRNYEYDEVADL